MSPDRLRRLLHLQPGRPAIAFGVRGAIASCAPLILATLADQLLLGLGMALGGLQGSMADVGGPYRSRAAAIAATAVAGAGAIFLGTVVSATPALAVAVVFVVSFACAMLSIYGGAAALAGLLINVSLLVGAGYGGDLHDALARGA